MTQEQALNILKLGRSVYLTGSAGSGKTYLLNQYIKYLKDQGVSVAVTASTGIAATHMNGVTIHSWSGLGIKDTLTSYDLESLESKKYLWDRMQNTKVLIIDEVSMLHHFRIDLVEQIVRFLKRSEDLWGGMQVILCGDFFQLPPVSRAYEPESRFIYHSKTWKEMDPTICYLEEQHRQADKKAFSILNSIRSNRVTEEARSELRSCFGRVLPPHLEPTRLYTHNIDVDRVNNQKLMEIEGEIKTYKMEDKGKSFLVELLKKSCLAPSDLSLKKGARVMFVKNNYERGYINGSQGIVTSLKEEGPEVTLYDGRIITALPEEWVIEEEGKIKAKVTQVPLRLAWAITVHKSQGMSLDAIEVDLSKTFEKGMGYVALSRARTFDNLRILGMNEMSLEVNNEVLEFDKFLLRKSREAEGEIESMELFDMRERHDRYIARVGKEVKEKKKKEPSCHKTLEFVLQGLLIKEIAEARGMTEGTILNHIETLAKEGSINLSNISYLKPDRFEDIREGFKKAQKDNEEMRLAPVRDILGPSYSFEELRLARLFL